jgi:DNA-binding MarR family transcriptional regulator
MTKHPSAEPARLDLGHLSLFVGLAFAGEVQDRLAAQGYGDVRFAHGFLIQHLVGADRTIGELATRLEVTQQAASKSVAELVTLRYVERVPDPDDARINRVRLSARGLEMLDASRKIRASVEKRLLAKHGDRKLDAVRAQLAEVLETLGGADAVRARKVRLPG